MKTFTVLFFAAFVFVIGTYAQNGSSNGSVAATSSTAETKRKVFRVTKEQITQAQKILKEKGLYAGAEDGRYSDDFRAAVREFQGANNLKRSGSLNRATLEKMGIALTDAQREIPVNPRDLDTGEKSPAKRGPVFRASKEQIAQVQKMLREKSLYAGEETGKLDDATREAVRKWQTANGVKPTGTLNKETLEKMGIELTERQKAM
jgi:peptidoglycan hydrolase-like protein with peptidoglycan-binding domain